MNLVSGMREFVCIPEPRATMGIPEFLFGEIDVQFGTLDMLISMFPFA